MSVPEMELKMRQSKMGFTWSALAMGFVGAALLDLIQWGYKLATGS